MSEKHLADAKVLREATDRHYNCAQSVLLPYAEELGIDREIAYDIANGFGGGMKTGSVCGAITGGIMALGLMGKATPENIARIFNGIKENHNGKVMCAELLKQSAEAGIARAEHCNGLVYEVIKIIDSME